MAGAELKSGLETDKAKMLLILIELLFAVRFKTTLPDKNFVCILLEIVTKIRCPAILLEKLGIMSEVSFLRIVMDGIPPLSDKRLIIKDLIFEKVQVRLYQPKTSTTGQRRGVLYFHGGVGRFGSIRKSCIYCNLLFRYDHVETLLFLCRYRLAPEYPYPTQFQDCLTATIHFMKTAQDYGVDPARIIVCGDSSGGTLTAAVAQQLCP
uniref:Alpha/beta hydrolase fold-3 domain-containing protein n=1 Tax=Coturnix japonica TaxID=93934 RepID=A0A8C2SNF9_COTJA